MGSPVSHFIMRFLVIASLIAITYSAELKRKVPSPRFGLIQERSFNGAPSVSIAFPDGYKDTLVLERYYANEEERMERTEACHYIGHLANEREACVAMTGCVGSEDVQFTIMSTHATESPMFKWTTEGNVEVIESPFKNGGASEVLQRGEGDYTEDGDEEVLTDQEAELIQFEEACVGGVCTLPATQLLQIRAGYDDGFKNKVGGTAQAEAYIAATWPHIQVSYCHSSFGSKVLVERLSGIKHYSGKSLQASGAKLQEMFTDTKNDIGSADLMLYMGYDTSYWGTVGIAWSPVVCQHSGYNKYKSSIISRCSSWYGDGETDLESDPINKEYQKDYKLIKPFSGEGEDEPMIEYEFEPETKSEVLVDMYEYLLASQVFHSFMDGAASEQSSRMTAMENASKNAGEMIDSLTLKYNRARQSRITTELIEIISGASAIEDS